MNRPTKITAACSPVGSPGVVIPPRNSVATPDTFNSGPFETEAGAASALTSLGNERRAGSGGERLDTAHSVGRQSERGSANTDADAGLSPAPLSGDPPNFVELGYGTGPRCIECRQNVSGCLCGPWDDDDLTSVSDMKRIMPRLFDNPADGSSWLRAERSALGMGGVK